MTTEAEKQSPVYNIKELMQFIPHRYPFLLVDKIVEFDMEEGFVLAQKNVTMNEPFFQGHFPEVPIMPGVLILEALAQAGGVLIGKKTQSNKIALLTTVQHAKFRHAVSPGDVLMLHIKEIHLSSKGGRVEARALVNEKLAAQAELGFALVDKSQI